MAFIGGQMRQRDYQAELKKKVEVWQAWFMDCMPKTVLAGFSFNQKACELISDNNCRWLDDLKWISRLRDENQIGECAFGSKYLVGFLDSFLSKEMGLKEIVPYVAKKLKNQLDRMG
ncbi:hypothetical protein R1flu_023830 [Riccia fluitans]|uniref:Uncharacterized protein n=1 Tax=Riccia fluitans TaxID=41844 RepID=A0ABD1XU00_9MARC